MAGSGGYFFSDSTKNLAESIRDLETKAKDESFESSVAGFLGGVLADANNRNVDAVATHLEAIKNALGKEIEGSVDLLFGGSVAKKTYVDGLSDVDTLVVLNKSELIDRTPTEVCSYIQDRLRERFPQTEVLPDGFAIDVKFSDVTVQLVPVIRQGDDYLLPDAPCEKWSYIRPKRFMDELTQTNKICANKLVPTIKLVKSLMRNLPDDKRLSGYHTEILATQIFSNYEGPYTPKAMLHRFFIEAPQLVRTPTIDPTGQSRFVDDHLGVPNSLERLIVADNIDRIGRRLRNADGAKSLEYWRDLF